MNDRDAIDLNSRLAALLTGATIVEATEKLYYEGDVTITVVKDGRRFRVTFSAAGDDAAHVVHDTEDV